MAECARCGDFTDNPADGRYNYCDSCLSRFNDVRGNGVVIQKSRPNGNYTIYVTTESEEHTGGTEANQTNALARGKHIADRLGTNALFEYEPHGSLWVVETYLQEHPSIRQDVMQRLNRVPDDQDRGFIERMKSLLP